MIKKFGLHPKDDVARQEGLMPAETCPDGGMGVLESSGCPGRWGVGMVRYPARGPGLQKVGTEERKEVGLGIPCCP